jgi:hypothetical protein
MSSALDAVPELISILPDIKTTNDIMKKPVALDDLLKKYSHPYLGLYFDVSDTNSSCAVVINTSPPYDFVLRRTFHK